LLPKTAFPIIRAAVRSTGKKFGPPKTIDDYLSRLGPDQRSALQQLRERIQAVVPEAEECISYQLPAFKLNGKFLLAFGAAANHCAFYPGAVVEDFKAELEDYKTSKGTIRFQPAKPLPAALVRKLVKARIARISRSY
jgi:uncharacterized protein YdhG (YjbR/CyaY superfamily)